MDTLWDVRHQASDQKQWFRSKAMVSIKSNAKYIIYDFAVNVRGICQCLAALSTNKYISKYWPHTICYISLHHFPYLQHQWLH